MSNRSFYRPEIDGMRAVAVLAVLLYHMTLVFDFHPAFENLIQGGFLGVDVFFVISGYLITGIILREVQGKGFSFKSFYERRARRIMPVLSVIVFLSIPFAWLLMDASELKQFGLSIIGIAGFASNFVFWKETGYFAGPAEYLPMLHTWSLAVEEQFYLFFPPLVLLFWQRGRRYFLPFMVAAFVLSLGLAHWGSTRFADATFFLPHTRIWELLAGAILAYFEGGSNKERNHPWGSLFASVGLLMIIASFMLFEKDTPHPSVLTLLPVVGSMLIVWFGGFNDITSRLLSTKPVVTVGLMSYSLYLWHVPILAYSSLYHLGQEPEGALWLVGLMFSLSWLSWQYVEIPCRNRQKLSIKSLLIGLGVIWSLLLAAGGLFYAYKGFPERLGYSAELAESFERSPIETFGKCNDNVGAHHKEKDWFCTFGSNTAATKFIITGDSHGFSALPAFKELAEKSNIKGIAITDSGCLPLLGIEMLRKDQHETSCRLLSDRLLKYAKEQQVKTIYLVTRWTYYTTFGKKIKDTITGITPQNLAKREQTIKTALERTVRAYNNIGVKVVVVGQVPMQNVEPRRIYSALYLPIMQNRGVPQQQTIKALSVTRSEHDKLQAFFTNTFTNMQSKGFTFINPTNTYCDNEVCPVGTPQQSFYFDDDHISVVGNKLLLDLLR